MATSMTNQESAMEKPLTCAVDLLHEDVLILMFSYLTFCDKIIATWYVRYDSIAIDFD